jgi:Ion channel
MYDNWAVNFTVVAAAAGAVALCVLVHYEGLLLTSRGLQRMGGQQRVKVLYGIFSMLILHVTEIWIFGAVIWILLQWPAYGHIVSGVSKDLGMLGLLDSVYLSAITYTTVGFGDVVPVGPIRFVSGMEALTGFLMIGWSASFTYLEMERFWRGR